MNVRFRNANVNDILRICDLLQDDALGQFREASGDLSFYESALREILASENNFVIVAINEDNLIIGTFQMTYIRNLTFQGGLRAQIEGVRVNKNFRGHGIGKIMIQHAIDLAKTKGCHLLQLTTNRDRLDAIRFYENLGFKSSHIGFKMTLD